MIKFIRKRLIKSPKKWKVGIRKLPTERNGLMRWKRHIGYVDDTGRAKTYYRYYGIGFWMFQIYLTNLSYYKGITIRI